MSEGSEGDEEEHGAEQFEPIDWEDGSPDESDESPESIRRPLLSGKQHIASQSDEEADDYGHHGDSDGMVGLENVNSDEDDPGNSPAKRGTRKTNSRGTQFTGPISKSITTSLPTKKILKAQPSHQKTAGHHRSSSNGIRSLATRTEDTSSTPPSSQGDPTPPRTPSHPTVIISGRARMHDHSPTSQGLLKTAVADARLDILVNDAFPDRLAFTSRSKAFYLAACNNYGAKDQHNKFLASEDYRKNILHILRQKLSQVRQEVRNMAVAKTAIHYGLSSSMNRADIVKRVQNLQKEMAFTFGDMKRKNPFGNSLFQLIINALFFEGKRRSDALDNPTPWNPMPLPVIALVVTAVHSVLDDWATGVNEAARSQFTTEKYEPVYRGYIANLEKFKMRAPAALARLQTSLWETAWASAGPRTITQPTFEIDDEIFDEAEAEALAAS